VKELAAGYTKKLFSKVESPLDKSDKRVAQALKIRS
jgi:hypothetical protein